MFQRITDGNIYISQLFKVLLEPYIHQTLIVCTTVRVCVFMDIAQEKKLQISLAMVPYKNKWSVDSIFISLGQQLHLEGNGILFSGLAN